MTEGIFDEAIVRVRAKFVAMVSTNLQCLVPKDDRKP